MGGFLRTLAFAAVFVGFINETFSISIQEEIALRSPNSGPITTYIIPGNDTYPEGIAKASNSSYFYNSGYLDSMIYRGNVNEKEVHPFINGTLYSPPLQPVGMKVDARGRLFVACAAQGVYIFDTHTKAILHHFSVAANGSFLNDLDLASDGTVYVSDSYLPVIYRITPDEVEATAVDAELKPWADLTGKVYYQPGEVSGDGIVVTGEQKYVLLSDYNEGKVYRVPRANAEDVKEMVFDHAVGGPDGFLVRGDKLYSVNGNIDLGGSYVAVVEIKEPYEKGHVLGYITSPLLVSSSTAAFDGDDLLVANFQYQRLPAAPELPFTIVRVDATKWNATF